MALTGFTGPLVVFGEAASSDNNPDRGPSLFDQGIALADPRTPFRYNPGSASSRVTYGWLGGVRLSVIDQVPAALSANNIATSQTPVAGTALTLTAGTGVTGSTSITNAATGATVTGLYALDTAMAPVRFGGGGDGAGGPIGIWNPAKGIARNVRITSAGNDSGGTFTVVGYDLYGYPMTETITGAAATVASGAKAFKYIASITPAGTLSGSAVTVGTGDVIGLPIRADNFGQVQIIYNDTVITASTGFTAAVTTDPATATTGDVRGTYALQTASNGSRRLVVYVTPSVTNISSATGLCGVTQA